ncbi:hypothetical protein ACF0H5_013447 [Mactra antiquata]
MSYGSTFVQFEANGRLSNRFSRPSCKKEEHAPKLVQYEKQFDVNLSRVDDHVKMKTNIKDSMVAYSRKMRTIQDTRNESRDTGKDDPLFVRAKHIPKYPTRQQKKRRPMSFDELLGRDRESKHDRPAAARSRPQSDKVKPAHARDVDRKSDNEVHLPLLTDRLRKTGNVQVNLVSASDLYDIVDFSLRSKASRNETLHMMKMEREVSKRRIPVQIPSHHVTDDYREFDRNDSYDAYERTINRSIDIGSKESKFSDTQRSEYERQESYEDEEEGQLPSNDFYAEMFNMQKVEPSLKKQPTVNMFSPLRLPVLSTDHFKRRPNRAKRMRLVDPGLGDIPEDNIVETRSSSNERRETTRISSPTPQKLSPRFLESPPKSPLDAILESSSRESEKVNEKHDVNEHTEKEPTTVREPSFPSPRMQETTVYDNHLYERKQYTGLFPHVDDSKSTKKVLVDDGDVRIEVTQCPPKTENGTNKLKAQKRFKKLIFLRDGSR